LLWERALYEIKLFLFEPGFVEFSGLPGLELFEWAGLFNRVNRGNSFRLINLGLDKYQKANKSFYQAGFAQRMR
jgi:hypothetical protein